MLGKVHCQIPSAAPAYEKCVAKPVCWPGPQKVRCQAIPRGKRAIPEHASIEKAGQECMTSVAQYLSAIAFISPEAGIELVTRINDSHLSETVKNRLTEMVNDKVKIAEFQCVGQGVPPSLWQTFFAPRIISRKASVNVILFKALLAFRPTVIREKR